MRQRERDTEGGRDREEGSKDGGGAGKEEGPLATSPPEATPEPPPALQGCVRPAQGPAVTRTLQSPREAPAPSRMSQAATALLSTW